MREIKFRAWWKDTMEPISDFMEQYTMDVLNNMSDNPFIYSQYTTVLDKNGKEIWEGDIVEKLGIIYKIVFKEGSFFMVQVGKIGEENIEWILGRQRNKPEVIGNIYENSEMLNGHEGLPTQGSG